MRHLILLLSATAVCGAFAVGCGDDTTGAGGSGGGSGGGATSSTTATASSGSTGGATASSSSGGDGGEGPTSTGQGGDPGTGGAGGGAGGSELISAACEASPDPLPSGGACITIGGTVECNPITNEGCEEDEQCDVIEVDTYICFPPGDKVQCEACDAENQFCAPGLSCTLYFSAFNAETEVGCGAYCCSDDDCPTGTTCQTVEHPIAPQLGLCLEAPLE